jgi:hypothetical protein
VRCCQNPLSVDEGSTTLNVGTEWYTDGFTTVNCDLRSVINNYLFVKKKLKKSSHIYFCSGSERCIMKSAPQVKVCVEGGSTTIGWVKILFLFSFLLEVRLLNTKVVLLATRQWGRCQKTKYPDSRNSKWQIIKNGKIVLEIGEHSPWLKFGQVPPAKARHP